MPTMPDYRPVRLASLRHELRVLQEERDAVNVRPDLSAEQKTVYWTYHDAILRWLQGQVTSLENQLAPVCASQAGNAQSDRAPVRIPDD